MTVEAGNVVKRLIVVSMVLVVVLFGAGVLGLSQGSTGGGFNALWQSLVGGEGDAEGRDAPHLALCRGVGGGRVGNQKHQQYRPSEGGRGSNGVPPSGSPGEGPSPLLRPRLLCPLFPPQPHVPSRHSTRVGIPAWKHRDG